MSALGTKRRRRDQFFLPCKDRTDLVVEGQIIGGDDERGRALAARLLHAEMILDQTGIPYFFTSCTSVLYLSCKSSGWKYTTSILLNSSPSSARQSERNSSVREAAKG